jgi:hypothetical protein
MSVFGVGALYGGEVDMLPEFIRQSVACVGWSAQEAPAAHKQMQSVKTGDIIFVKSFNQSHGLYVKAVGICVDNEFRKITTALGFGVGVRWVWVGEKSIKVGKLNDKFDFLRCGTIYEEYNEELIRILVNLMIDGKVE